MAHRLTLKIVQVRWYLGYRLSLSRNLRLNGISRNACPCNRTVGTAAAKGGERPKEEWRPSERGRRRDRAGRDAPEGLKRKGRLFVQLPARACISVRVGGCNCPGARGWRGTGAMGGARMAFCGQSSMCLYAVMCYRFLARSPASSMPTLMPDGIVGCPELCQINPSPESVSSSLILCDLSIPLCLPAHACELIDAS